MQRKSFHIYPHIFESCSCYKFSNRKEILVDFICSTLKQFNLGRIVCKVLTGNLLWWEFILQMSLKNKANLSFLSSNFWSFVWTNIHELFCSSPLFGNGGRRRLMELDGNLCGNSGRDLFLFNVDWEADFITTFKYFYAARSENFLFWYQKLLKRIKNRQLAEQFNNEIAYNPINKSSTVWIINNSWRKDKYFNQSSFLASVWISLAHLPRHQFAMGKRFPLIHISSN